MRQLNILAFSGSIRNQSINSGLIRAAIELASDQAKVTVANIRDLPMYNQDLESSYPLALTNLKNQIIAADGILIATPEYNRSIPGVLKNMFDWTSRPYGETAWSGKSVATMGASLGAVGTALAQYHLKQILLYLNANVMGQPEFYVNNATDKFDGEGNLVDQKIRIGMKEFLNSFWLYIS